MSAGADQRDLLATGLHDDCRQTFCGAHPAPPGNPLTCAAASGDWGDGAIELGALFHAAYVK